MSNLNPWDTSTAKHMHISEDEDQSAMRDRIASMPAILSPMDTERVVESLKKFDISQIGTCLTNEYPSLAAGIFRMVEWVHYVRLAKYSSILPDKTVVIYNLYF